MAIVRCVEPANESGPDKHIVIARAGDTLLLPHVDVCFGIVFILANGTLVGGHVPMQWDGTQALSQANRLVNAQTVLAGMLGAAIGLGSGVSKIVTIGDDVNNGWAPVFGVLPNPPNARLHIRTADFSGGADLTLNVSAATLTAQYCNHPTKSVARGFNVIGPGPSSHRLI
jgi:hypothetical protein